MKPAATTWATLSGWQQVFFYMHYPTNRIAHTKTFVKRRVALIGTRNSSRGPP